VEFFRIHVWIYHPIYLGYIIIYQRKPPTLHFF
jgi:hypothetical protein